MRGFWKLLGLWFPLAGWAQGSWPPAAGKPGSSALFKDTSLFVSWAPRCEVERGFINIADKSLGRVNYGNPVDATGTSNPAVVSLGDSGIAIITFDGVVFDGPGYDFSVFENGLSDSYLEYAFVEVSSDGLHYFRFAPYFEGDTTIQIGPYDQRGEATEVHQLAGKYRAQYGTPFDISDLPYHSALNKDSIRYIRLIDVVGSLDDRYCQRDALGRKINDSWPTPFATNNRYTGGFDLDAVGFVHYLGEIFTGIWQVADKGRTSVSIYPNPAIKSFAVADYGFQEIHLVTVDGATHTLPYCVRGADLDGMQPGVYVVLNPEKQMLGRLVVQ